MPDGGAFVVPRDGRGLAALRGRCREAGVTDIALEASGGYEQEVLDGLADGDWRIHLLNPRRVRRFAEAAGVLAKTDPIDARVIALFTRHFPRPASSAGRPGRAAWPSSCACARCCARPSTTHATSSSTCASRRCANSSSRTAPAWRAASRPSTPTSPPRSRPTANAAARPPSCARCAASARCSPPACSPCCPSSAP
ncbi:MAG: transposase [Rhodospirillales bacterium]|nr:MAG: transposase [Rhodospirillales bacterium]